MDRFGRTESRPNPPPSLFPKYNRSAPNSEGMRGGSSGFVNPSGSRNRPSDNGPDRTRRPYHHHQSTPRTGNQTAGQTASRLDNPRASLKSGAIRTPSNSVFGHSAAPTRNPATKSQPLHKSIPGRKDGWTQGTSSASSSTLPVSSNRPYHLTQAQKEWLKGREETVKTMTTKMKGIGMAESAEAPAEQALLAHIVSLEQDLENPEAIERDPTYVAKLRESLSFLRIVLKTLPSGEEDAEVRKETLDMVREHLKALNRAVFTLLNPNPIIPAEYSAQQSQPPPN